LKVHYTSRIKEEYVRRYAIAKKQYDDATPEERESGAVKKPIAVQLRTEVGKEFWNLETEEFCGEMGQESEDLHLKEVEEWQMSKTVPKTPQQFHQ
jgi:hypothetical protein